MDDTDWPSTQVPDSAAAGGDWRAQLRPDERGMSVNKIMETLQKIVRLSVPEALKELQKICVQTEEKIYTAATDRSDYLRRIYLKVHAMEINTRQAPGNAQVIIPDVYSAHGQMVGNGQLIHVKHQQMLMSQRLQQNSLMKPQIQQQQSSSQSSQMQSSQQPMMQMSSLDIYAAKRQILMQQKQMLLMQNLRQNSLMQPQIQQQQPSLQPSSMQSSQQSMMQMSSGHQPEQSTVPRAHEMAILEELFKEL